MLSEHSTADWDDTRSDGRNDTVLKGELSGVRESSGMECSGHRSCVPESYDMDVEEVHVQRACPRATAGMKARANIIRDLST